MPSYAQDVKNELAHQTDSDIDCLRAEFVALLKVGSKKIDGRFEFANSNLFTVSEDTNNAFICTRC